MDSRLEDLVAELELAGDWTDRYRTLVAWGEEMDSLAEAERVAAFEVPGCSSPLWLKAWWEGTVFRVQGASPGILPQALVALVVRLFDGLETVSGSAPGVLGRLGLTRHLSPTRSLVLERMVDRCLSCGEQPR